MSNNDSITRMILDNIDQVNRGNLGEKLVEHVTKKRDEKEELQLSEDDQRISDMKEDEDAKNLIWMDYESWNNVSVKFREYIAEKFNPLFWGGVFFRKSDFDVHKWDMLNLLNTDGSLALLTEVKGNHKLMWVSQDTWSYDFMGEREFNKVQSNFKERLVTSYGKESDGTLVEVLKREDNKKTILKSDGELVEGVCGGE